jgi:hypothetical protein
MRGREGHQRGAPLSSLAETRFGSCLAPGSRRLVTALLSACYERGGSFGARSRAAYAAFFATTTPSCSCVTPTAIDAGCFPAGACAAASTHYRPRDGKWRQSSGCRAAIGARSGAWQRVPVTADGRAERAFAGRARTTSRLTRSSVASSRGAKSSALPAGSPPTRCPRTARTRLISSTAWDGYEGRSIVGEPGRSGVGGVLRASRDDPE